jgi:hypothetical protein
MAVGPSALASCLQSSKPHKRPPPRSMCNTGRQNRFDGALEIICGFLLWVVPATALNSAVVRFTQHELSEDPDDWIANSLRHAVSHYLYKYQAIHVCVTAASRSDQNRPGHWSLGPQTLDVSGGARLFWVYLSAINAIDSHKHTLSACCC